MFMAQINTVHCPLKAFCPFLAVQMIYVPRLLVLSPRNRQFDQMATVHNRQMHTNNTGQRKPVIVTTDLQNKTDAVRPNNSADLRCTCTFPNTMWNDVWCRNEERDPNLDKPFGVFWEEHTLNSTPQITEKQKLVYETFPMLATSSLCKCLLLCFVRNVCGWNHCFLCSADRPVFVHGVEPARRDAGRPCSSLRNVKRLQQPDGCSGSPHTVYLPRHAWHTADNNALWPRNPFWSLVGFYQIWKQTYQTLVMFA